MKTIVAGGAIAALCLCAGCASEPYVRSNAVAVDAAGQPTDPVITMKDGKRHEIMVGSRIARETRENSESVRTVGRKAFQEGRLEKPGSPLGDGM